MHLSGRVLRGVAGAERALAGVVVTLHRVGADRQGPVDSVRTGADGRYALSFRAHLGEQAVYFAAVLYDGIAYFTPAVRAESIGEASGDLTVYDTTTKTFPLRVQGRHIVIGAPDARGGRTVVEVYEIDNDSARTLVTSADPGATPTFVALVPAAASDFRVGQSDVSEDAVRFIGGRVLIDAPFAPGVKQVAFAYALPPGAFPLRLSAERPIGLLEVLTEESGASVSGGGLTAANPVNVEGRVLARYQAQRVPAGAVIEVALAAPSSFNRRNVVVTVLMVLGVVMLLALTRSLNRRGREARRGGADEPPERIARRIADLDAAFARERAPSEERRARYDADRAAMKAHLTEVLARRAGDT
jgi:hypothetical protein